MKKIATIIVLIALAIGGIFAATSVMAQGAPANPASPAEAPFEYSPPPGWVITAQGSLVDPIPTSFSFTPTRRTMVFWVTYDPCWDGNRVGYGASVMTPVNLKWDEPVPNPDPLTPWCSIPRYYWVLAYKEFPYEDEIQDVVLDFSQQLTDSGLEISERQYLSLADWPTYYGYLPRVTN